MIRGRWGEPLVDPANQYSPTYNYGVLKPSTLQSSLPTSPRKDTTGSGWRRALQGMGLSSPSSGRDAFRASVEAASAGHRNPYSNPGEAGAQPGMLPGRGRPQDPYANPGATTYGGTTARSGSGGRPTPGTGRGAMDAYAARAAQRQSARGVQGSRPASNPQSLREWAELAREEFTKLADDYRR